MENRWFEFQFSSRVIAGAGTAKCLGDEVRKAGGKRTLVVTGPKIASAGVLEGALTSLGDAGVEWTLHKKSGIDPSSQDIEVGRQAFLESGSDNLVAIGGGSRIDAAKGIRLLASHAGDISAYYADVGGMDKIKAAMPPLISIPTTAGSGSEVSRGALITDTASKRKRLIAGPGLPSTTVILDPELSANLPANLTAATGLDALSHAIETYSSSTHNPVVDMYSKNAAHLVSVHLAAAVKDGQDIESRMNMLMASSMAAVGFSKGLGVVHSLAHQLSPLGIQHALAISVLLPHGMAFNVEVAQEKYTQLGQAMGFCDTNGDSISAAEDTIDGVRGMVSGFGLPSTLSDLGVGKGSLPELAANAMLDHCHRTNPRPCSEEDMLSILTSAL